MPSRSYKDAFPAGDVALSLEYTLFGYAHCLPTPTREGVSWLRVASLHAKRQLGKMTSKFPKNDYSQKLASFHHGWPWRPAAGREWAPHLASLAAAQADLPLIT